MWGKPANQQGVVGHNGQAYAKLYGTTLKTIIFHCSEGAGVYLAVLRTPWTHFGFLFLVLAFTLNALKASGFTPSLNRATVSFLDATE